MLPLPQAPQCYVNGISCHSGDCYCPKLQASSVLDPLFLFSSILGPLCSVLPSNLPPSLQERTSSVIPQAPLALSRAAAWAGLLPAEEEWDVDNKMDPVVLLYISSCIIHQLGKHGSGEIFIDTRNVTRVLILHPLKVITGKSWLQNVTRG